VKRGAPGVTRGRIPRMEAAIAMLGIIICAIVGLYVSLTIPNDDSPALKQYAALFVLASFALYFLIRFIHWAWDTPMPFVGTN
jgi:hypothetical protein